MMFTINKTVRISTQLIADTLIKYCREHQYGLAIWQLPDSSEKHVVVSFSPKLHITDKIESLQAGFVVAAFENGSRGEKYYLQADVYFTFQDEVPPEINLREKLPGIHFFSVEEQFSLEAVPAPKESIHHYKKEAGKAIDRIKDRDFKKLVLARKKTARLKGFISLGNAFLTLLRKYPETFNSLIYTPAFGLWMGASPELLVSRNQQNFFKTVALAGTQLVKSQTEKEAVWSQKEIEEQAYVSKFIVERLKKIRLREFEDIGPRTVRAGQLYHLKTEFLVNLNEVDYPELLSDMLEMLHPTSAVCGMPQEEAMNYILKNEGFNRELYSGYLGPVNINGETHIYVNLRCTKITSDEITFFAGAGLTEDSVPDKEFEEIESKMQSLESCFSFKH